MSISSMIGIDVKNWLLEYTDERKIGSLVLAVCSTRMLIYACIIKWPGDGGGEGMEVALPNLLSFFIWLE